MWRECGSSFELSAGARGVCRGGLADRASSSPQEGARGVCRGGLADRVISLRECEMSV